MHYSAIKNCDIANGVGCRVSLFVSGCRNHCKGCFQPETWDFEHGKLFTRETEDQIVEMLRPDYINGLSILGGDPFEPENQVVLLPFVRYVKMCLPSKTIWAYTGYELEALRHNEVTDELLSLIDVLVDGRFEEDKKDISLLFRGSSNQRIIDIKKSKESIVLWNQTEWWHK